MLNKLREVEDHYNKIVEETSLPEVVSDVTRFRDLMREQKRLMPIVEKYREYSAILGECEDAKAMMEGESDSELRAFAEIEYYALRDRLPAIEEELKILLLPRDPDDDRNVIVEIRGGVGGEEAALFAHSLHRMYTMFAEKMRWKTEIITLNETELGGCKEVSFLVEGEGAYEKLKFESGVHRVQRVPETETQGRIHTSTATVAVLPEVEEVELEIRDCDIKMETAKSSGAGGQHVNKTESAVRLIHLPTGTIVESQEERSQYKNREKAMKLLRAKLLDDMRREQNDAIASARKSMVGTGDRRERIRTYNFPQGRVTDHRIGLTLYKIDAVMNGALDELIDALVTADNAEKLSRGSETQ